MGSDAADIAKALLRRAQDGGFVVACAESCTGGMLAAALTDLAGSSQLLDRGFVTYSNAAKIDMLDVNAETLKAHGAVSEQVAAEMAAGALARSCATVAVAITGIAGPGGSEHKPEGRVCFGQAQTNGDAVQIITQTVEFGALGRAEVRRAARDHALGLLAQAAPST